MTGVLDVVRSTRSYPAQVEGRVVSEAGELMREFPSLVPEVGRLRRADGSLVSLLAMRGVLPISYNGAQYNIPVQVFVTEYYPNMAPLAYVTPTASMVVRSNHPFVDPSGLVRHPYLSEWDSARCSLTGLAIVLVSVFSQRPPVYARPRQPTPPTAAYPNQYPGSHGSSATGGALHSSDSSHGLHSQLHGHASFNSSRNDAELLSHHSSADLSKTVSAGARQRELMDKCNDAVRLKLDDERESAKQKMLELYKERNELSSGASSIQEGLSSLQLQTNNKQAQVERLEAELEALETWLERNKGSGKEEDEDPDALMSHANDAAQEQVLKSIAENHALQDLLYVLEEAMDVGLIDCSTYLKETRKIGREQFYARALLRKIRLKSAEESRGGAPLPGAVPPQVHRG